MGIDVDDRRAPYLQVADALRDGIRAGEYAPGDRLPTVNDLVKRFEVARNTVQRAIDVLREEGYVTAWQGRGIFVRSVTPEQRQGADSMTYDAIIERLEAMHDEIQDLADRLGRLESRQRRQRDA